MELFFTHPSELYYVREIVRETKEEINAIRRELERMETVGLLRCEPRANRNYYFLNPHYVYFQELQRMVVKSTGLGREIRKLRKKLGKIEFVMFSGEFVADKPPRQDRVDVLVVGEVVLPEITALVKEEEQKRGHEINFTVFGSDEFTFRKARRDPFVMDMLYGSRVMVIGNEIEFTQREVPGL